jgi:hypothetical protein
MGHARPVIDLDELKREAQRKSGGIETETSLSGAFAMAPKNSKQNVMDENQRDEEEWNAQRKDEQCAEGSGIHIHPSGIASGASPMKDHDAEAGKSA